MKVTTSAQMEAAMQRTKELAAQVAEAAAKDIAALTAEDVGAAKKSHTHISVMSVTIPATGWSSDGTAGYPKYYDITVPGLTAADKADVDISPASLSAAVSCGLCPVTETLAGAIRLRAVSVPAASMTATYWVEKGV